MLVRALSEEHLGQYADSIMMGTITIFETKNLALYQDAFLVTGAVADRLESRFERYQEKVHPAIVLGLKNREAYTVCNAAVCTLGDMCRALEGRIFKNCDELMMALLENLQDTSLNRSVKPTVLSCFGDIALALNGNFEK